MYRSPEMGWRIVPAAWKQSVLLRLPDSFPKQSAPPFPPAFSQCDMPNLPHFEQYPPCWTRSVPQHCLPERWRIPAACWQKALLSVPKWSFPWISATRLSRQTWEPVLLFLHICVFHLPVWFEFLSVKSLLIRNFSNIKTAGNCRSSRFLFCDAKITSHR